MLCDHYAILERLVSIYFYFLIHYNVVELWFNKNSFIFFKIESIYIRNGFYFIKINLHRIKISFLNYLMIIIYVSKFIRSNKRCYCEKRWYLIELM